MYTPCTFRPSRKKTKFDLSNADCRFRIRFKNGLLPVYSHRKFPWRIFNMHIILFSLNSKINYTLARDSSVLNTAVLQACDVTEFYLPSGRVAFISGAFFRPPPRPIY